MEFSSPYNSIKKHINNPNYYSDDITVQNFKDEIDAQHSYLGAQHLYLRNKLEKHKHISNMRNLDYTDEYIKKYDSAYYIIFVI